uniref:Uncharacterized protein n=1 Tax=Anguilla anguilla TaxID=7936 RepID=A0A0E9W868_ANGAN
MSQRQCSSNDFNSLQLPLGCEHHGYSEIYCSYSFSASQGFIIIHPCNGLSQCTATFMLH